MRFTIPILVEERPQREARVNAFQVRPLFHAEPVQRADKLSRALTRLENDLREKLVQLGREPRHDELARWTFNPPLEETTLELRLELRSGSHKGLFFFAGYPALDRKLWFTTTVPELHFEVLPGQELRDRAVEVLTHHFRQRERDEEAELKLVENGSRLRLTTLELELQPAALARVPEKERRAFLFGSLEKKDGEQELRRVGRALHLAYPDDLERAVDRETEVGELARRLAAPDRRPLLLVGPRKVGKTAIVHELVWRIRSRLTEKYGGRREVWLLSPMRLISGMSYLGEWENRVVAILEHAKKRDKVLYFDDLPGLFAAGISSASDLNVAQVLKPALEKLDVRVLAEITPEAWRWLREKDRAFAELFQVIPVRETTEAETMRVLVSVARQIEEAHRCEFDLAVLPLVFDLYRRFGADAAFPGKAAGFLYRLGVRFEGTAVTAAGTLAEFQEQSGLHPAFLDDGVELKRASLLESLRQELVGQEPALAAFVDVLVKLKARLHDPRRPLGTFLLLGPTGVGKTQAAKALAMFLFGRADRLLRFDMNEFVDGSSASRLTGTPREPDGLLTGAIRRQPFSVVLLDEIEKASPEVFDLLLAVLDEGRLTDSLGRVADFTQSIIVLTSNLGAREARAKLGFQPGDPGDREIYLGAAAKFFRPEFFNRLDRIIPFAELTPEQLEAIARRLIHDVFHRDGLRRRECLLHVTPAAISHLVKQGHHPQLGARALKRVIEREVAQPLAAQLAAMATGSPIMACLDACGDQCRLQLDELRPVARSVTWGDDAVAPRTAAAERKWLKDLVKSVEALLDRVDGALEESAPSGPLELGRVAPEQARYFHCREQWRKVERLIGAVTASLNRSAGRAPITHRPKSRPRRLQLRQFISGTPEFDRARAAESLNLELSELDAAEAIDVPETPAGALLREMALLEAMLAQPADDRPLLLLIRALNSIDDDEASRLAGIYREALGGVWGCTCVQLNPPADAKNAQGTLPGQGLWCEGLNLRRLVTAGRHRVLLRRQDGTLGILEVEVRHATDEADARQMFDEAISSSATASGESSAPVHQRIVAGKTLTDYRSGLVVPADPSPDEARAWLLSALPLERVRVE